MDTISLSANKKSIITIILIIILLIIGRFTGVLRKPT